MPFLLYMCAHILCYCLSEFNTFSAREETQYSFSKDHFIFFLLKVVSILLSGENIWPSSVWAWTRWCADLSYRWTLGCTIKWRSCRSCHEFPTKLWSRWPPQACNLVRSYAFIKDAFQILPCPLPRIILINVALITTFCDSHAVGCFWKPYGTDAPFCFNSSYCSAAPVPTQYRIKFRMVCNHLWQAWGIESQRVMPSFY